MLYNEYTETNQFHLIQGNVFRNIFAQSSAIYVLMSNSQRNFRHIMKGNVYVEVFGQLSAILATEQIFNEFDQQSDDAIIQ